VLPQKDGTVSVPVRSDPGRTGTLTSLVIERKVRINRQEEADHERVVGWNKPAMTKRNVEAAEKLCMQLAKERAQLNAECTEDEVGQEAAPCQEAICSVLNAMAKQIRICARSKGRWNANIEVRRKTAGRENSTSANSEEAAQAKAEIQKSVQQSKRRIWNDYM